MRSCLCSWCRFVGFARWRRYIDLIGTRDLFAVNEAEMVFVAICDSGMRKDEHQCGEKGGCFHS